MSMKGRMNVSIQLIDGVWVCMAECVPLDPTSGNAFVKLAPWSIFQEKIAERYPELFQKWKDLMMEIMRHEAARINKQTPAETKIHNAKDARKDQN